MGVALKYSRVVDEAIVSGVSPCTGHSYMSDMTRVVNLRQLPCTRQSGRSSSVAWCLFIMVLISLFCEHAVSARIYVVKQKGNSKPCKVHRNPMLHEVMDRICVMCHEMFSHERPNMRSDCRSKCFRSEHFRACLNVFSSTEADVTNLLNTVELDKKV